MSVALGQLTVKWKEKVSRNTSILWLTSVINENWSAKKHYIGSKPSLILNESLLLWYFSLFLQMCDIANNICIHNVSHRSKIQHVHKLLQTISRSLGYFSATIFESNVALLKFCRIVCHRDDSSLCTHRQKYCNFYLKRFSSIHTSKKLFYLVSFRLLFAAGFVGLALTRRRWSIGSLTVRENEWMNDENHFK